MLFQQSLLFGFQLFLCMNIFVYKVMALLAKTSYIIHAFRAASSGYNVMIVLNGALPAKQTFAILIMKDGIIAVFETKQSTLLVFPVADTGILHLRKIKAVNFDRYIRNGIIS